MLLSKSALSDDEVAWSCGLDDPATVAAVRTTGDINGLGFGQVMDMLTACGYEMRLDVHRVERVSRMRQYREAMRP